MTVKAFWGVSILNVINLNNLINVPDDSLTKIEEQYSLNIKKQKDKGDKYTEQESLKEFLKHLQNNGNKYISTDGFIFNYTELQLTEFDILKNTTDFILNIELKGGELPESKIQKQLRQHKFYLSKTNKNIYIYTYNAATNRLYMLDNEDNLVNGDIDSLITYMNTPYDTTFDISDVLAPENFIISPFNNPVEFMNDNYLLNDTQISHKNTLKTSNENFFVVGKPGTGKTLLMYDLAKTYISENKSVLIIHCGKLNNGHRVLKSNYNMNIEPIKYITSINLNEYDLIIIDEMQRLKPGQPSEIIAQANGKVIFSGDPDQTLQATHNTENPSELGYKLKSTDIIDRFCTDHALKKITLKQKIRTNKWLSEFIKGLMDVTYLPSTNQNIKRYVNFVYFDDYTKAKVYWNNLLLDKPNRNKLLSLPSSQFNPDIYKEFDRENSFDVIGQEFDTVTTVVGSNITYNENGKMDSFDTYYPSSKALFQNITRTKKGLNFVIINNPTFLKRLLELL